MSGIGSVRYFYQKNDLIISFMIAAPQPDNLFRCGYVCFYNGEFHDVYQLPEVPVFTDLMISIESQLFNETFSNATRIFTRPRHLVWTILNPPCRVYKLFPKYKGYNDVKNILYKELKKRNIGIYPALSGTVQYLIHEIGINIVKMRLRKYFGPDIDDKKLHKLNMKYMKQLQDKGVYINYGESVLKDKYGIRISE